MVRKGTSYLNHPTNDNAVCRREKKIGFKCLAVLSAVLFIALMNCSVVMGEIVFEDDFENGNVQGWLLFAPGSTADTGEWEIGDPNGTVAYDEQAQPEDAWEGVGCAFTEQNSTAGVGDVDLGVTYLQSPVIDLSGMTGATLSYYRWFYNRDRGEDDQDFFAVEVRESGEAPWIELERLGHEVLANSWTYRSFPLEEYINLTGTVQFRFGVCDGARFMMGSIVEGAIDNVEVSGSITYGNGDFNDDGDVDFEDFAAFQRCFGNVGTGDCAAANMAGSSIVDDEDWIEFSLKLDGS